MTYGYNNQAINEINTYFALLLIYAIKRGILKPLSQKLLNKHSDKAGPIIRSLDISRGISFENA